MVSSQMIEVWKLSEKQDKHTTNDKQTMDLMHSGNSIDSRGRVGGGHIQTAFRDGWGDLSLHIYHMSNCPRQLEIYVWF